MTTVIQAQENFPRSNQSVGRIYNDDQLLERYRFRRDDILWLTDEFGEALGSSPSCEREGWHR